MTEPKIVASASKQPKASWGGTGRDNGPAWAALGWLALAFIVVGGADFLLTWLPSAFGNREWEFGTVTQSFNALPVVLLGIGLVLAAGECSQRAWLTGLGTAVAGLLLAWVLLGVALWLLSVPIALATVPDNLELGVRKAAAKTAVQSIVYPALLTYFLVRAWSNRKRRVAERDAA